jgi:uncharacterized protein YrrD/polyhydroxyalkanoate synthesis regulator phasin
MASLPKTLRQSELVGRRVLLRDTLQELGQVELVWMHPPVHRVFGFICASGFFGAKKSAFNLPQIHALGEDGLVVNSNPVQTDARKVRQIESLLGYELWSDAGDKVGHVIDYVFDTETGAIQFYLLTSHPLGALTDGIYQLPPRQMLSYGDRRIRIRDRAVQSLQLYQPGLKQKLAHVGESVLEEAGEEWRSLTEQALNLREQAREQWHALTQQAKEKAVPLSEQAKERAQSLTQRAKLQGQEWMERLREQTQILREQFLAEFASEIENDWDPEATEAAWQAFQAEHAPDATPETLNPNAASNISSDASREEDAAWEDWEDGVIFRSPFENPLDRTTAFETSQPPEDSELEEPEDDDEDEWDTWDLEESDLPTEPYPPEAKPDGNLNGQGTAERGDRPEDTLLSEPENGETFVSEGDTPAEDPPGSDPLGMEETGPEEHHEPLEERASVPQHPLPTDPIPPEDLEDDDPWI